MKKIYFFTLALICAFVANAADIKICVKQNSTFNDTNIGTLNFYYWNAQSSSAGWPGQAFSAANKTTQNGETFYYQTVTIGSGDWGMLFNINGDANKTGDMKGPKEDTYYEITLSSEGKLVVNPAFTNPNASGYYLYGNEINAWSKDNNYELLKTSKDKVYEIKNVTLAGFFKVGSADWSESFGPLGDNQQIAVGTPTTIAKSGESRNLYLDGTYIADVTLDLSGSEPVMTISGQKTKSGVYLKGAMNGWSDNEGFQFTSLGGGVYELEKNIRADEGAFKITANGLWYGADATSYDAEFEVNTGAGDMTLPEGSAASKFRFFISEDQNKGTLTISQGAIKEGIFLMGNVNNWSADDAYKFEATETEGIYTLANIRLQGYFKIADSIWKDINIGGNGDGFVEVGEAVECLNGPESANFYLDGTYNCELITLDLTGNVPVILIEGEQTTSGIYLCSAVNQWGAATDMEAWEFIDNGEGFYTLDVTLKATDGEFNININGVTAGLSASAELVYDDMYTLDGNKNMTLAAGTKAGSFELYIGDDNSAVLCVYEGFEEEPSEPTNPDPSAVEEINAGNNAAVEYFNLQGIKISADKLGNGIYVKKQGTTATKVVL